MKLLFSKKNNSKAKFFRLATSSKSISPTSRKEKDSLGLVDIPVDAPWGAQTARALRNFPISGHVADPALVRAYLRLKRAAATANERSGNLDPLLSDFICDAIDELLELSDEDLKEFFPIDVYQAGAGTSQNMNVNEVVANLANLRARRPFGSYAPIHPNDHVNRSQSTNDTFPTAMRLALLEVSGDLVSSLRQLAQTFLSKGESWLDIPKAGRTHLQDAVPIRLGEEFRAYGNTLLRAATWIDEAREDLRELGIGGSAAGTGLNVPPGFIEAILVELSTLTGEPLRGSPHLYEAMQSQANVGRYSSSLRQLALELTRICNDLRLLSSGPNTGIGELILPAVQPGSSIMPGKVNPSILEMANQVWFAVLGRDHAVSLALQAGQLELNVMMPLMASELLEASRIATRAIRTLDEKCIRGIEPDRDRLRRYFESTPQIATALSPRLGYAKTAELVKESLRTGTSIVELVRRNRLIPEKELQDLLKVV